MAKRSEYSQAEAAVVAKAKCMYCSADAEYTASHPTRAPAKVCRTHGQQLLNHERAEMEREYGECHCSPSRYQFCTA